MFKKYNHFHENVPGRKHSLVDSITDFEFEDPGSIPLRAKSFCIVKIDENFCLGVILCEKHDDDIIFS